MNNNTEKTETTLWDIVTKYYPNYDRCDDIALSDDLQKLLDKEQTEVRVYGINCNELPSADFNPKALVDEQFIEVAEQQGNIWNLSTFQDALNNEEVNNMNYFFRFIEIQKPEIIVNKTSVYAFGSDLVTALENGDMDHAKELLTDENAGGVLHCFAGNETIEEVLTAYDGWNDYFKLSEEEITFMVENKLF